MKKQFLILILFVAAIVAGTTNAFAQVGAALPYVVEPTAAPACITPEALAGCTADELHPVQGQTYDYTVATTDGTDIVRWFVVDNTAMETAGDSLISKLTGILAAGNDAIDDASGNDPYILNHVSSASVTYDGAGAAASTNATIQLQWKYFDGVNNEVLLVAYVEGADGCTNNIAVMRIIPTPAFTIDVASILEDGSSPAGPGVTPNEECVSPIESAVYTGTGTSPETTTEVLTVDYGENWVFFVVNGANYFDSWMPEFQISYNGGEDDPVAEMSWAYLADWTNSISGGPVWNSLTGSDVLSSTATTWTGSTPVIANADGSNAGQTGGGFEVGDGRVPVTGGECIVVRVRLDWGTDIEHDEANSTLTFAANGIAYDGVGTTTAELFSDRTNFEDLNNTPGADAADQCKPDSFTNDVVDYIITPRPQVEEGSPTHELKTGQGVN